MDSHCLDALQAVTEYYKLNVNKGDCQGTTPLHLACRKRGGGVEAAGILLEIGAWFGGEDDVRITPLYLINQELRTQQSGIGVGRRRRDFVTMMQSKLGKVFDLFHFLNEAEFGVRYELESRQRDE